MSYGLDWSDQDYNTVKFKYKSYNPNGYWFKLRSSKIKNMRIWNSIIAFQWCIT